MKTDKNTVVFTSSDVEKIDKKLEDAIRKKNGGSLTVKNKDVLTSQLVEMYGCTGCKHCHDKDEFLSSACRFFCLKHKKTYELDEKAHLDCKYWAFCGDDALVEGLLQGKLPE